VFAPLTNRFVGLGFIAAVVATILGAAVSPDHPLTAISAFGRATAYVCLVFAAAAITTYLGFMVSGEGRTIRARKVAVRSAAVAVWLPPLLMFSDQGSWFALVIWAALVAEVARLIAFVRTMLRDDAEAPPLTPPDRPPFSVPKQDFPSGISILGALMIQGAIVVAVGDHDVLAGLFYVAGTSAIACRMLQMFQHLPTRSHHALKGRILAALMAATLLIVFAWLPHIAGSGGSGAGADFAGNATSVRGPARSQVLDKDGPRQSKQIKQGSGTGLARLRDLFAFGTSGPSGSSFEALRRILDTTLAEPSDGSSARMKNLQNTKIASAVFVGGPVFAGVELYPEVAPHNRLVAPPLAGTAGFSMARSDPLSIPFDGVYWFWRGPSDQPPSNSVVMHGSPSARFFRSADGDGMSMEARQNLGFAVDPKRYSAIEIEIQNADPFPNSVSILLKIRNTTIPGKPIQTLGMEAVSTSVSSAGSVASRQTLRFHIPSSIVMGSFDELTVSYYLKGARSDKSARIAIDGFRLVPRGG
jgi:hypothetical protein